MRLLHIIATPRGHLSNTIRISNALIEELYLRHERLDVQILDLFQADLPAVAGINIENKYKLMTGQELDVQQQSAWDAIEATIHEFLDADLYVITTPMWNFTVPYVLKYYIDTIVQPGYLFRYDERGVPHGLVKDKKMIVVTSRGADYSSQSQLHTLDFLTPYLRTIFNFVGITDIRFINAQPMDISADHRRAALLQAIGEARSLAADGDQWLQTADEDLLFPEGTKPPPLRAALVE